MKPTQRNKNGKDHRTRTKRRADGIHAAELPQNVQDFLEKFREWEESFRSPTRRKQYIQRVCERIAECYKPEKIILFGSHAYGQPTPESDLDLLIVMDFEGTPARQAIKISRELGFVTPMDLLVRTPEQFQERLRIEDPFMREIAQRGKVMYETSHG
jgi:predicted nucleotidyltransferase